MKLSKTEKAARKIGKKIGVLTKSQVDELILKSIRKSGLSKNFDYLVKK